MLLIFVCVILCMITLGIYHYYFNHTINKQNEHNIQGAIIYDINPIIYYIPSKTDIKLSNKKDLPIMCKITDENNSNKMFSDI